MKRRLKRVGMSDCLVADFFRRGFRESVVSRDPLPEDGRLVGCSFDGRILWLTFESDSFAEVEEGSNPPDLNPWFTARPPGG